MHDKGEIVLFSSSQIQDKVNDLAKNIASDYSGKKIIIVCVLNGGYLFFSDLSKALWNAGLQKFEVDFVQVSSYGNEKKSSGKPILTKDIEINPQGKDVLIVDDIIETGHTLKFLKEMFTEKNTSSVKTCALLLKAHRKVELEPDYVGFEVSPNDWVEGYGLDTASFGRGRSNIIKKV
jgi:hypoxanthine phosphoribosyltransferase